MDQPDNNHWRSMFERGRRDQPSGAADWSRNGDAAQRGGNAAPGSPSAFGFDDGYDPALESASGRERGPLSAEEITDEAAMALALDAPEYRPWVLQRGRSRPALMLHLRRYEPKSGLWIGWQLAYPHLVAVEYVGDRMLSLDFGTRQFVIEGTGLDELARHMQTGSVLVVQEFSSAVGHKCASGHTVSRIQPISAGGSCNVG